MLTESPIEITEQLIMNQPMVYGGSWGWTRKYGGYLANLVMDRINESVMSQILHHALAGYHPVIDTKVVQLMPGQYPCIPGWHCDGVIRKARGEQPDLNTLNEHVMHYVCSFCSEDTSKTSVMLDSINLDVDENNVWSSVNEQVKPNRVKHLRSGQVGMFTRDRLHQGTPATKRCWRYFFRLSFYHMPAMNQLRKQVQVYTDVGKGW
jgi:hypothetical protein